MPQAQGSNVVVALEATVHRVLAALAAELDELALSHGEINALAQLTPGSTRTVSELQAATGQRASTLTGVLDRLERRGLIERRLNPDDRRSFTVELTEPGAEACVRIAEAFRRLHRRALSGVSERSARGFFETLAALDALGAED